MHPEVVTRPKSAEVADLKSSVFPQDSGTASSVSYHRDVRWRFDPLPPMLVVGSGGKPLQDRPSFQEIRG